MVEPDELKPTEEEAPPNEDKRTTTDARAKPSRTGITIVLAKCA
jgi:hypothetical protein